MEGGIILQQDITIPIAEEFFFSSLSHEDFLSGGILFQDGGSFFWVLFVCIISKQFSAQKS